MQDIIFNEPFTHEQRDTLSNWGVNDKLLVLVESFLNEIQNEDDDTLQSAMRFKLPYELVWESGKLKKELLTYFKFLVPSDQIKEYFILNIACDINHQPFLVQTQFFNKEDWDKVYPHSYNFYIWHVESVTKEIGFVKYST